MTRFLNVQKLLLLKTLRDQYVQTSVEIMVLTGVMAQFSKHAVILISIHVLNGEMIFNVIMVAMAQHASKQ